MALLAMIVIAFPAYAEKRIALSFDDIPRQNGAFLGYDERAIKLIAALNKAGVKQAVFFLNPAKLVEEQGKGGEDRIAAYVAAGHVIANHSNSHPSLSNLSAEAYLADIDEAEKWLKGRPGYRPWFRFPFLNEGRQDKVKRDAVRAGLKSRGLGNGYVTAECSDWHIESLATAAVKAGKAIDMEALRNLYVECHVKAANFYDELAVKTLGRSPAHVMLLHETDIAALFIGDLVAGLRKKGWTIISADAAYKDQIGKLMPNTPSAQGTLTEALAWEKGLPAPRWYEGINTDVLTAQFNEKVLKEAPAK
jgi:peptidoglycan-N-acetylglucosamine deacetylase